MFLWNVDIVDSPLRGEYLTHFLMRKNVETHCPRHIKVDWVVECDTAKKENRKKKKYGEKKKKKKKKKPGASNVQCCSCYIPFIYHFKLRYFDGFSAVRLLVPMQR